MILFSSFTHSDGMSVSWDDLLPVELWLLVFSLLGADATPEDWRQVGLVCWKWHSTRSDWVQCWLRTQPLGSMFCPFEGIKTDLWFVREHMVGRLERS
jgi:hypothetical protein